VHRVTGIRGYSQNNNVALRASEGRYVAILNDDTIMQDDVFGRLVGFLDQHPDVVGACPVLRLPSGRVQLGLRGRYTPLSLLAEQLKVDRLLPASWAIRLGAVGRAWAPPPDTGPVDIEAGTGACFVARRQALEAIGLLDEDYFLGPDDVDWTLRLRRLGRIVLLPDVSLVHLGGTTLGGTYDAVLPAVFAGYYRLLRRHRGRAAEWAIRILLGFGWSALLAATWAAVRLVTGSARAGTLMRGRAACARYAFSRLESPQVYARVARRGR